MTTTLAIEAPVGDSGEGHLAGLIAAAREGDRAALEALLESIERRVYGFAYRLTGNRAVAEDVAQEVFLKICRRLHQYRGGSFLGWTYRIVVRQVQDWRRAAGPVTEELPDALASRPADAEREEQLRRLEAAMQVLTEKERQALVLTEIEGFTSVEAARVLGCLAITVRVRTATARKKLRRALSRYYPELREDV
jgi:RNA polymerase sigma-70 factor (ECF subfamily)